MSNAATTVRHARFDRRALIARAAALGLAAPFFAAGWTPRGIAVAAQDGGKILVAAIPQATVQLDPAVAGSNGYGDIIPLADNITEGLTRFRSGSADVEPALAEGWDISEDGLTYVFHIRPNVTFHDGTPLDAKGVELNYLRQFDPEHPLHNEGMVYAPIVFADVEKIEATGEMDLTITLSRPSILLPGNLAIFAAGLLSPKALEEQGADVGQSPVGTGPFRFESWTKDVELVLTANNDYWDGRPALDRVVWRTIPDDTVRLSELRTGGIDVANQVDFKDTDDIESDPNLQLITGAFFNTQYLALNGAVAPFDNVTVRKAVQHAVNKMNIAEAVFYSRYVIGAGPIAPELLGYDANLVEMYPYDPDKARELLAEAGGGEIAFDLFNRPNSFWPIVGQLIQADLAAVGITANIRMMEDAEFFDALNRGEAPAFINDWTWDNGDPDNIMYPLFASPNTPTRLGYKNDKVNELVAAGAVTADPDARWEIYGEAQQLILDDAIMVILGYPERAIGTAKAVQGLVISPVGSLPLGKVDLASG